MAWSPPEAATEEWTPPEANEWVPPEAVAAPPEQKHYGPSAAMHAVMDFVNKPLLPHVAAPQQEGLPMQIVAGVNNAAGNLAEGLSTPANIALLPLAGVKTLGRVVAGLFGAKMLSDIPEQIHAAEAAPTVQGKLEGGLGVLGNLFLGTGAAVHASGLRAKLGPILGEKPAEVLPTPDQVIPEPVRPASEPLPNEAILTPETAAVAEAKPAGTSEAGRALAEPAPSNAVASAVQEPVRAGADEIAPAGKKSRLDLILDGVEKNGEITVTLEGPKATRETVQKVQAAAEARGMTAAFDGNGFLIRKNPSETAPKTAGEVANEQAQVQEGQIAGKTEVQASGLETPSTTGEVANDWTSATLPKLEAKPTEVAPAPEPIGIVPPGVAQLQKASAAAGAALKKIATSIKDVPKLTDFRKSVLDWSATNQKSSGEIIKAAADLNKSVPDVTRREGITNWIQAGGDVAELQKRAAATTNGKLKKGYEAALALTPEEQALAGKVRQTYDIMLQRAKSNGIEISEIENYVNQIWRRQPLKEFSASSNRKLSTSVRFAKQRYYDSFFDGEQNGLKPETKDIAKLLPIYLNEVNNAISAKQFVAKLSEGKASDGRPLLAPRGSAKVLVGEEGAGTQLVFPESATKDTADYRPLEQPALHNWKWVGTDAESGTTTLVRSDLAVHPEAYSHLKKVLGQSAIREWYQEPSAHPLGDVPKAVVKFLLDDVQQVGKATMLGFLSPFHQVQESTHAIGHKVNPFSGIPKINLSDPAQMDAARHGLMLLPDRISAQQFREGLDGSKRNLLANAIGKLGGKPGEMVKAWADGYQDYLFHEYIPGLKLKTYEHILDRNMKRYVDELANGDITEPQVKYLSAQQSNAAYGHLNYADIGRNPTMQHIAQIFLLAPDFLEARGRFAAQALKPSKAGREQLAAIATLAATQYFLSRALNQTLDNDPHWDQPFDVVVGNRRYSMRSVPADIYHAFTDTRRFVSGRLSPLIGRGLLEGLSGVNYRREPTTAAESLTNIIAGMVPLTAQPFTRGLSETGRDNPVSPFEQLLGSLGLHVSRFSPSSAVYEWSKEWVDKHGKDYGIDPKRAVFPISKFQQLRYALEDSNNEKAKAEVADLLKSEKIDRKELDKRFHSALNHAFTGSKATDEKFRASLNQNDKQVYDAALKRRELLYKRYQGIR